MPDTFDPRTITWVLTDRDLANLLVAVDSAIEVVMDLETTGLDEYADGRESRNGGVPARIVLASLTLPQESDYNPSQPTTWVVPLSHPDSPWLGQWRRVMREIAQTIVVAERPLVNQNVKFDARWVFAQTGVDLSKRIVWDTRNGAHLLDENQSTKLKVGVPRTFDVPPWDDFDLTYPGAAEEVPLFDLGAYAARDTYWTWVWANWQRHEMLLDEDAVGHEPETAEEIELARLGRLALWCSMPTVATLTGIEQTGMLLDRAWVKRELAEHIDAAAVLSITLAHLYPSMDPALASWAPTSHWFRDWTQAAVDAGDLVVAELTPTGKARWSKGVLTRQARRGSRVAAMILDQRSHSKKAEFLNAWLGYVTLDDEIHATYNTASVVTGRLSSSGPNMQQVTASLKPAFIPRPGHLFAEFDYSQIELRVAAHIAECKPMIEAFKNGEDLHTLLASRITGKPIEEITKDERQAGKSANFGLLYLMGPYGFREYAEDVYGVVFTREEAIGIHQTYFDTWEGLAAWHAKTIDRVRQTGKVVSPIGRVRRLPEIWTSDNGGPERAAVNSPVQGFASDMMQMAAASIAGNLPGTDPVIGATLVATVHDSILVEVPAEGWEAVVSECKTRMLDLTRVLSRLDCELLVPLAVDVKVGTRWGLDDVKAGA